MGETRRFKTQGKVEGLLYEGGFPLDFLQPGETVSCVPGRGMDGSCYIEGSPQGSPITVEKGELIVRSLDGSLHVLPEVPDECPEPGERCDNCGDPIPYVWWCHDDELWEEVTGNKREPGSREPAAGLWCIPCFDAAAQDKSGWLEWAPLNVRHISSHAA